MAYHAHRTLSRASLVHHGVDLAAGAESTPRVGSVEISPRLARQPCQDHLLWLPPEGCPPPGRPRRGRAGGPSVARQAALAWAVSRPDRHCPRLGRLMLPQRSRSVPSWPAACPPGSSRRRDTISGCGAPGSGPSKQQPRAGVVGCRRAPRQLCASSAPTRPATPNDLPRRAARTRNGPRPPTLIFDSRTAKSTGPAAPPACWRE